MKMTLLFIKTDEKDKSMLSILKNVCTFTKYLDLIFLRR